MPAKRRHLLCIRENLRPFFERRLNVLGIDHSFDNDHSRENGIYTVRCSASDAQYVTAWLEGVSAATSWEVPFKTRFTLPRVIECTFAHVCDNELIEDEENLEDFEKVLRTAKSISEIVDQLYAYTGIEHGDGWQFVLDALAEGVGETIH